MKNLKFLLLALCLAAPPVGAQQISALPAASTLNGAEVAPVVQSGTTKKATVANIAALGTVDSIADSDTTHSPSRNAVFDALALKANASVFSVYGLTLVDDVDAATARSTLGLGNVDNTADVSKPISTATQTALDLKAPLASPTFTGTVSGITAAMVGAPSGSGTSTGTNTGDQTSIVGITGSLSEFNAALTGADFATGGGTATGTNTGDQTSVTGNAGTATALAANGSNCSAGSAPLGVDATGNAESCTSYAQTASPTFTGLATFANTTAPGAGAGSEKFGLSSTAAGGASLAVGPGATSAGLESVAIGSTASAPSTGAVVIGSRASATVTSGNEIAIGFTANAKGGSIAIGNNTTTNGAGGNISIGPGATTSGVAGVAIGYSASAGHQGAIAIGRGSASTAVSQLIIGGGANGYDTISDVFIGTGVTNATPGNTVYHGSGASGTDHVGGTISLASGIGTGSASPGLVKISGDALGGTTGSTAHSLVNRVTFNGTGKSLTSGVAASLFDVPLAASPSSGGGEVFYTITATDGTDIQVTSGMVRWAARRTGAGPTYAQNVSMSTEATTASAGALSSTWALVSGSNKMTMQVTATSTTITPTTFEIVYEVHSQGRSDVNVVPF